VTLYLFDVDGTLLLSGGAGKRALEQVFHDRYGLADAMADIRPNGRTDPWIVEAMFQKLGRKAEEAEIAWLLGEYERALAAEIEHSPNFRLMPGAREAVVQLADRGAALGLATGNTLEGARIKLERGGLWRYFAPDGRPIGGFGSDSGDRATLVRLAIERAQERLGRRFAPADVLVIGDTPHDVAAARAVGTRMVALATGGHSVEELRACGAHEVYATLSDWLAGPGAGLSHGPIRTS